MEVLYGFLGFGEGNGQVCGAMWQGHSHSTDRSVVGLRLGGAW